jgi:STE24 endopeptidase
MPSFDPAVATARYMATLSPEAHARATAYTQGGHWLLLWGWAVSVVVAVLVLRSGLLDRLRRRSDPTGTKPKRAAFQVALAFVTADAVLTLPWTIYSGWWRERQYQLTSQGFGGWFGEWALQLLISALVTSLFLLALYTLIRRTPRHWWLWASGVAAAGVILMLVIGPIPIEPLFNRYTPAPAGPVRDAVVALAQATNVPHDKIYIYNGSKQSDRYTANVSGLFGSARVAMSDTMFRQNADRSEVIGVVGHEMGHYARHHILWSVAFLVIVAVAGFWLTDRLFPVAARILGDPARRLADPAGLPVLSALLATLALLATPILMTETRMEEADADAFSMRYAHEPDGLSKALVKTIAYRASSPSALEEFLFYDHPSVERRVRHAMAWKAAHPRGVGAPFGPLPAGE